MGDVLETEYEDRITCPHCGDVDYDMTDYPQALKNDGDEVERECGNCGKEFTVALSVSYTFYSKALATPNPEHDNG